MLGNERRLEVLLFVVLTFGITWGLAGLFFAFPAWIESIFGPPSAIHPLFVIAVWSPNIAAVALVLTRGGWPVLKDLLSRLLRWRASPWMWLAAILFYPALMLLVQLIGLAFGQPLAGLDVWLQGVVIGSLSLPILLLGPLGEELGWRGYLLPRLLEGMSAIVAGLVVGVIWMVWHLPAFFIAGLPQDDMAIPIFFVAGIALSVYVTWLFVNTRQSILIAGIIPHAIVNAYGEATGDMTWVQALVMVAGAALLLAILGRHLKGGQRRSWPW
ncbi:MAG: CPBP family intramembrane metalloprotease [Gammaproteobacteria bacterium]|nr:CPBP family intramembrane metalloprotease [Gammaproteobacteria bacterium]